jgi:hypothetical protein
MLIDKNKVVEAENGRISTGLTYMCYWAKTQLDITNLLNYHVTELLN